MAGKWHVTLHVDHWRKRKRYTSKHNWPKQRGFDHFYGTITGGGSFFNPVGLVRDNSPIEPKKKKYYYTDAISDEAGSFIRQHSLFSDTPCQLILEPGRFLVGGAGLFLTRAIRVKESGGRKFVIVDGAMNDFLRPSLYGAQHLVWPVGGPPPPEDHLPSGEVDIVGPVCESGDFLARDRDLPEVKPGDLLALFGAGAYGSSMSSHYNSRCSPAEVVVDQGEARLVRHRGSLADLWRGEVV